MEPLEKQNDDVKKEEIRLVVGLSSLEVTHASWLPQFVVSLAVIRGSVHQGNLHKFIIATYQFLKGITFRHRVDPAPKTLDNQCISGRCI
jgi:hypothetical protein